MSNRLAIEFRYDENPLGLVYYKGVSDGIDAMSTMANVISAIDQTSINRKEDASFEVTKFGNPNDKNYERLGMEWVDSKFTFDPDEFDKYKGQSEYEFIWDLHENHIKSDIFAISDDDGGIDDYLIIGDPTTFNGEMLEVDKIDSYIELFAKYPTVKYGDLFYTIG